ncbi:unnamed protein product [Tetraodon nigroviridis]|uniref:(spotted green pufferfish) hypothetical protein n=1 Tax=Tetraodon nigroviridis TaxID=99883 RepID=Q4SF54_TETNG|nr:unnamed protein product [Tetraodon nigroviridis]
MFNFLPCLSSFIPGRCAGFICARVRALGRAWEGGGLDFSKTETKPSRRRLLSRQTPPSNTLLRVSCSQRRRKRHGLSAVPRPACVRSRDAAWLRSRDAAWLRSRDARPAAAHPGGDGDHLPGPRQVEHGHVRLLQRHGHLLLRPLLLPLHAVPDGRGLRLVLLHALAGLLLRGVLHPALQHPRAPQHPRLLLRRLLQALLVLPLRLVPDEPGDEDQEEQRRQHRGHHHTDESLVSTLWWSAFGFLDLSCEFSYISKQHRFFFLFQCHFEGKKPCKN